MTELPEIERYAKEILAKGAQNVIISMAGDGALLVSPSGTYFAKPIKGQVKNSVGAGDSMVAGFTGKLATTGDVIEAFKWGVACGTATTFSDDLATADYIKETYEKVEVGKTMKIQDVLNKNVMLFDLQATDKEGVINEMVQSLVDNGVVTDFDTFKTGIMNREAQTSTGLGDGIAMPHSKNEAVKEATVLFAKSNKGVDYASLDGQPTDLFFMIAAPEGANDTHLAALAELSKYLMKPGFADKLRQASTPDQVIAAFDAEEQVAAAEEAQKSRSGQRSSFI